VTFFRVALKWSGIILGLAVLSLIGFFFAAWLSPGDPGRSYLYGALGFAVLTVLWRVFAPRRWQ